MERCVATNRAGKRCKNWPIKGGAVCRMHGGAAPRVRAAAHRRLTQPPDPPRRTASSLKPSELRVYDYLVAHDFIVCRNGWPDFLCIAPDSGHIFAVEVKSGVQMLRAAQVDVAWWLSKAGMMTWVVYDSAPAILPFDAPPQCPDIQTMRNGLMRGGLTRSEREALMGLAY